MRLTSLIAAMALSAGCGGDKVLDPSCSGPTGLSLIQLNVEIESSIEALTGSAFCVDLSYNRTAFDRCALVVDAEGPIYLDPGLYLPEDKMFTKLAHEYGHIILGHTEEISYLNCLF